MKIMQMYNNGYLTSMIQNLLTGKHIELSGISEEQSTGKLHIHGSIYNGKSDTSFARHQTIMEPMIQKLTGREVALHICGMPPQGPIIMRSW